MTAAGKARGGWSPTTLAIGVAGGLSSGLLGVGGGIVLVPLMTRFLGLDQRRATGTSLSILIFTAIAAALAYRAAGPVDIARAAWLALGAIPAATLGANATARFSSQRLRQAFGLLMILVGLRMCLVNLPAGTWLDQPGAAGIACDIATGFVVGFLSGFLGVGGGTVLVPILTLLFGLAQHDAQGISLFMIIPTSIVGAWTHLRLGNVERPIIAPIALSSVVAAVAGAALAFLASGPLLRVLFGALLVVIGVRMMRHAPRAHEAGAAGLAGSE